MASDWLCYSSLCKSNSINTDQILLVSSVFPKLSLSCSNLSVCKRTQRRRFASGISFLLYLEMLVWIGFSTFFCLLKIFISSADSASYCG